MYHQILENILWQVIQTNKDLIIYGASVHAGSKQTVVAFRAHPRQGRDCEREEERAQDMSKSSGSGEAPLASQAAGPSRPYAGVEVGEEDFAEEALARAAGMTSLGPRGPHAQDFRQECSLCTYASPYGTPFAYVRADTLEFRVPTGQVVDNDIYTLACYNCCAVHHGVRYLTAEGFLNASWVQQAKQSKTGAHNVLLAEPPDYHDDDDDAADGTAPQAALAAPAGRGSIHAEAPLAPQAALALPASGRLLVTPAAGADMAAQAFDGAAGMTSLGARAGEFSHSCSWCDYTSPFASHFAYIYADMHDFRVVSDEGLDRALSHGEWQQRGGAPVRWSCFNCCGKFHQQQYTNAQGKLTSRWSNSAKRSKVSGGSKKVAGLQSMLSFSSL